MGEAESVAIESRLLESFEEMVLYVEDVSKMLVAMALELYSDNA